MFVLLFEFCLFSVCELFLVLIPSFCFVLSFCGFKEKKIQKKNIEKPKKRTENRTLGEGVGFNMTGWVRHPENHILVRSEPDPVLEFESERKLK